jgi:hypothetical protein
LHKTVAKLQAPPLFESFPMKNQAIHQGEWISADTNFSEETQKSEKPWWLSPCLGNMERANFFA